MPRYHLPLLRLSLGLDEPLSEGPSVSVVSGTLRVEPRKRDKEFLMLQVPLGEGPPLYNLSFLMTPACFLESLDEKTKLAR